MKKQICLVIALSITLALSACSRMEGSIETVNGTGGAAGTESKDSADAIIDMVPIKINNAVGVCEQSMYCLNVYDLVVAPEGYYARNMNFGSCYITYISKDSAKEIYLCGKPDCSHVSTGGDILKSCNAYVDYVLPGSLVYHNGYVYMLRYNGSTMDVMLVRVSADGSTHEELMIVGKAADRDSSYYEYVFVDDNILAMKYYDPGEIIEWGKDTSLAEGCSTLYMIDLAKKEQKAAAVYDGAEIRELKVLNNNVFFRLIEKKKYEKDHYAGYLMRYDTKSGQTAKVLAIEDVASYTVAEDGALFYSVDGEGVYRYDLQAMDTQLIWKSDENTLRVMLAYDGAYLYLDNCDTHYFSEDRSIPQKIYVCTQDGELVNAIPTGKFPYYVYVTDADYMFMMDVNEDGEYWVYIKKEDIRKPDVTWSKVVGMQ